MTANEMKNAARNLTVTMLKEALEANDAVQFADASYAILQNIDGREIWTEVTIKSKAYKPTRTSAAFDPYKAAEAWKTETEMKWQEKEKKKKEKEEKKKGD